MARRWELDALRGLMLVLMFSTHLPTRFADSLGQPFGFVSAAEGFVMLSAYMAGMISTRSAQRHGLDHMRRTFLRRALKVYACQVGCLLLLFSVIAALGLKFDQPALKNLIGFYLSDPLTALAGALLLIYNPPLLDILPLYVMLMLASPWVLAHGLRHGWRGIFTVSIALWIAAQFNLSFLLYQLLALPAGLPIPFRETGSFETFAWQFLWVFGLWMGSLDASGALQARNAFPRPVVLASIAVAALFFAWRHVTGQSPFPDGHPLNVWFDKWRLGPLRMLDFFALLVLVMHFGERLKTMAPRMRFLETMGAASLPVFCAHLVVVLLTLALLGENLGERSQQQDALLLLSGLAALYLVGVASLTVEKRAAQADSG